MIIEAYDEVSSYHTNPGEITQIEYCINVIAINKGDDGPWFNLIFDDLNELEMFSNGVTEMIEMWKEYDKE